MIVTLIRKSTEGLDVLSSLLQSQGSRDETAMAVACGQGHTATVTEDGGLWTWGAGDDGQLGHALLEHSLLPALVGGLEMLAACFVMLAAGMWHSAALSSDGVVWTWSGGVSGCLGYGKVQARSTPTRLDKAAFGGSAVVMVVCGRFLTMVVTADGVLWSFGLGCFGALGHGDTEDKLIPTRVGSRFRGAKIVMVAAGHYHSIAAMANSDVYTWGYGGEGSLGHNDQEDKLVPTKLDCALLEGVGWWWCRPEHFITWQ